MDAVLDARVNELVEKLEKLEKRVEQQQQLIDRLDAEIAYLSKKHDGEMENYQWYEGVDKEVPENFTKKLRKIINIHNEEIDQLPDDDGIVDTGNNAERYWGESGPVGP